MIGKVIRLIENATVECLRDGKPYTKTTIPAGGTLVVESVSGHPHVSVPFTLDARVLGSDLRVRIDRRTAKAEVVADTLKQHLYGVIGD